MKDFNGYTALIFGDFNHMDNVNYNFDIISTLIESACKENGEKAQYYYKPVFILLMAIIESILYDILLRIQNHHKENSVKLEEVDRKKIQDLDLPKKLKNYVDICRKYELIAPKDNPTIYQEILNLAEFRNRIHIQNQKNSRDRKEEFLWSKDIVKNGGGVLKKLVEYVVKTHPRPEDIHQTSHISHFPTPWDKL